MKRRSGESIQETALREVNHETGLNISEITPVNFNYSYEYLKGLKIINASVSCFIARATDDSVILSNEHDYYKWVDFNRAVQLLEFEEQKKLLNFFYNQMVK